MENKTEMDFLPFGQAIRRRRKMLGYTQEQLGKLLDVDQSAVSKWERMASAQWHHPSYVFATRTGRPLHPGSFNVYFTRVLRKAGLPHIRFHDLRHTAATLMLGPQRINIRTVSEVLGHADISTTLRIYAHVLDSMRQEVADKMDEMFVV